MKNSGAVVFVGLGFELVGLILGAFALGQQVDKYLHWDGLGVVGLIVAVMLGWMYHVVVLLKRYAETTDDEGDTKKPG